MRGLVDLFPHFDRRMISTRGANIFVRLGGNGPPLVLLHGYPQTHAMWHRVAPELAQQFSLIIPDLRGYGSSSIPADTQDHFSYSKRAMAQDVCDIMDSLGHAEFLICGHDRGGRVAYRLALDNPERVSRLAVLDIIPTYDMWHGLTPQLAMKTFHWTFLAQPVPWPERMIGVTRLPGWKQKSDHGTEPAAFPFSTPMRWIIIALFRQRRSLTCNLRRLPGWRDL